MAENIKLRIEITDNGSFKDLTINGEDFKKIVKQITQETNELNGEFVKMASRLQIWQNMSSMIGQIQEVMTDLTSAYTVQSSAETRLAQAMRNTMSASQEEINSIKELCSVQQQLGIIGDEIQLSGAQELATYLQKTQSLKTLIPVMNDMVAQQYGYNASAESATQIASMLGKVMNGQVEALSRYGYKFDEAQKYILKYGDEEERVAVLAQVVEEAVGGMNEKMAQTPEGRLAQWNNNLGDMKERLGQMATRFQSLITTAGGISRSVLSIKQLRETMKGLAIVSLDTNNRLTLTNRSLLNLNLSSIKASIGLTATKAAAFGLNAVLSAGIIGLVALLVNGLISIFSSSKKATEGLNELDDATRAYRDASAEMKGALAGEIVALQNIKGQHDKEIEKVNELNSKYGEAFGIHQTAAEWYDVLINKSQDYCRQLGYEAQAKVYAKQLGDKLLELDEANETVDNYIKENNGQEPLKESITTYDNPAAYQEGGGLSKPIIKRVVTDYGLAVEKRDTKQKEVDDLTSKMQSATQKAQASADKVNEGKTSTPTTEPTPLTPNTKKDKYDGSTLIEDAKSYKELGNNIKYYENALDSADISNTELIVSLSKSIAETKKQQQAIKEVKDATMLEAEKPTAPKSLEEVTSLEQIDKAIEYQRKLRSKANGEQLKGIDTEIARLNDLKTAFEDSTHVELQDEQIKTFKQLQDEISYYSRKLQTADADERTIIQGKINHLQELQEQWQSVLDELNKPGDISTLNTIEELEDAITYYTAKQKKVSGEEALAIQKTIDSINRKKEAQDKLLKIPQMQRELGELDSLSGKELSIELHLVGLNEIQSKIRSLQAMLNDLENPLDDKQREQVNALITSYKNYEKILKKSDASLVQGWGNIKGITGSIESMTQTLKEDGNAWKKITSVVDGAIQIYQSLSGIIELIKVFTGVTEAQTVAEQIKGDTALETGSKTVSGKAMEIGASEAATTQAGIETTANVAKGVSGLMSAYSSIPFVGFAVGAALAAAFLAMMASLPKFAEGGIAFGPTLGIFGEYSGASTNPEVVAPLDKLKNLFGDGGNGGGKVVFEIKGRTLRGVLQKETHYTSRTK